MTPSEMTFGVTTTSRATTGGDATPIRLRPRRFVPPRSARGMPSIRSTRPSSPNSSTGAPVSASSAIRYASWVPKKMRASSPSLHHATPREL